RIGLIRLKGVIRRTHHIILDQDLETDSLIEEHGALRKAIHIRTPKGVLKLQVPKEEQDKIRKNIELAKNIDGNILTDLNLTKQVTMLTFSLTDFKDSIRDIIDRSLHHSKFPGSTYSYTGLPSFSNGITPHGGNRLNERPNHLSRLNSFSYTEPNINNPFAENDPRYNYNQNIPQQPPSMSRDYPQNQYQPLYSRESTLHQKPISNEIHNESSEYNKLRGEFFALQQSIDWIKKQYDDGRINSVEYLNQFQNLEKKRYIVEQKLKKFGNFSPNRKDYYSIPIERRTNQDPFSF
ncbi:MAG: hypothetical protein ACTSUV_03695, partial [Candidatus Ranarchaeia archaeon]